MHKFVQAQKCAKALKIKESRKLNGLRDSFSLVEAAGVEPVTHPLKPLILRYFSVLSANLSVK